MRYRYRSKFFIPVAAILMVLIAYVNYLKGLEFSLFPLYMILLAIISWNEGLAVVLCMTALTALSISAKAWLSPHYSTDFLRYWDWFVKVSMLFLFSCGAWKIKMLLQEKDRLNSALETTLIDLKQVQERLQQTNQSLEQAVAERTQDLASTVRDLEEEVEERTRMATVLQAETAERMRVQSELREKELLLMQQSRLAAMGEMIGNIAHQWRQPLNRLALLTQDVLLTHETGMADGEYLEEHRGKDDGNDRAHVRDRGGFQELLQA